MALLRSNIVATEVDRSSEDDDMVPVAEESSMLQLQAFPERHLNSEQDVEEWTGSTSCSTKKARDAEPNQILSIFVPFPSRFSRRKVLLRPAMERSKCSWAAA
jgi:hypothetical protein